MSRTDKADEAVLCGGPGWQSGRLWRYAAGPNKRLWSPLALKVAWPGWDAMSGIVDPAMRWNSEMTRGAFLRKMSKASQHCRHDDVSTAMMGC